MEDQKTLMLLDRISNLPPSIIETILCRLPTKEAVRTSILSTEWKYNWTKLPKFEFTERFDLPKLFSVTNQVISMHDSPIQEFSLTTYVRGTFVEVDRIIDAFSRNNNLKKLTLDIYGYRIPQSFFSLHNLTHLHLQRCFLDVPPTFSGFPSLTNLSIYASKTTKGMLQLFLSACPLLKIVKLCKLSRIPDFGTLLDKDDSTLAQLFNCLPAEIESLTFSFTTAEFYDQGRVPNQLPAALVHLKHLRILDDMDYKYRFHCLVFLLRSCPNIEKLTLELFRNIREPSLGKDSYSDIWLGHLNEVEIYFSSKGTSFHSIGVILGKSPVLKKVKIFLAHDASQDDKSFIPRTFSICPRLSRDVEFIVTRGMLVI